MENELKISINLPDGLTSYEAVISKDTNEIQFVVEYSKVQISAIGGKETNGNLIKSESVVRESN